MSVWKGGAFKCVMEEMQETVEETNKKIEDHQ